MTDSDGAFGFAEKRSVGRRSTPIDRGTVVAHIETRYVSAASAKYVVRTQTGSTHDLSVYEKGGGPIRSYGFEVDGDIAGRGYRRTATEAYDAGMATIAAIDSLNAPGPTIKAGARTWLAPLHHRLALGMPEAFDEPVIHASSLNTRLHEHGYDDAMDHDQAVQAVREILVGSAATA